MDHTKSDSLIAIQELEKFYEKLFPYKSEFELWDNLLRNALEKKCYVKRVTSFRWSFDRIPHGE